MADFDLVLIWFTTQIFGQIWNLRMTQSPAQSLKPGPEQGLDLWDEHVIRYTASYLLVDIRIAEARISFA